MCGHDAPSARSTVLAVGSADPVPARKELAESGKPGGLSRLVAARKSWPALAMQDVASGSPRAKVGITWRLDMTGSFLSGFAHAGFRNDRNASVRLPARCFRQFDHRCRTSHSISPVVSVQPRKPRLRTSDADRGQWIASRVWHVFIGKDRQLLSTLSNCLPTARQSKSLNCKIRMGSLGGCWIDCRQAIA